MRRPTPLREACRRSGTASSPSRLWVHRGGRRRSLHQLQPEHYVGGDGADAHVDRCDDARHRWLGTIFGPLIGTGILTVLQTSLVEYPGIQLTILGTILLIIVVFVPGGLVEFISRTYRRIKDWAAEDEITDPTDAGTTVPETEDSSGQAAAESPPDG
jgi:hypothetical protein